MTEQGEKFSRYGFVVDRRANKIEIKNEIEKVYNVSVENINTMICTAKTKSRFTTGGLINGKTNTVKKAVVTLAEGDTIDHFNSI